MLEGSRNFDSPWATQRSSRNYRCCPVESSSDEESTRFFSRCDITDFFADMYICMYNVHLPAQTSLFPTSPSQVTDTMTISRDLAPIFNRYQPSPIRDIDCYSPQPISDRRTELNNVMQEAARTAYPSPLSLLYLHRPLARRLTQQLFRLP
jgi:hypothetical protein